MDDVVSPPTDSILLLPPTSPSSSVTGTCRLCSKSSPVSSLIRPCTCTAPTPFVHPACLDSWRAFNLDGQSFSHCYQCHSSYSFAPVIDSDEAALERALSWQSHTSLFVTWLAIALLASVLFLAIFINALDLQSHIPPSFPSLSAPMAYLVVAILVLLGLLTLWGVVAFSYGLHLPMAYRSNYHETPAEYAYEPNRHHFFFCGIHSASARHPLCFCQAFTLLLPGIHSASGQYLLCFWQASTLLLAGIHSASGQFPLCFWPVLSFRKFSLIESLFTFAFGRHFASILRILLTLVESHHNGCWYSPASFSSQ